MAIPTPRRDKIMNGGGLSSPRNSGGGRPIPKRGQVKVGIVVGLAHSLASIFSLHHRNGSGGGGAHQFPH